MLIQILLYMWLTFGQLLEPAIPNGCTTPEVVTGENFGISSMECTR